MEEVLQPETSVTSLYESKIFNDKERNEIFNLYTKLMYYHRYSIEAAFEEDSKTIDFINAFFREWPELKKKISEFSKKSKEGWEKDTDIKEELGYMG